jgi:hypothetical protein
VILPDIFITLGRRATFVLFNPGQINPLHEIADGGDSFGGGCDAIE